MGMVPVANELMSGSQWLSLDRSILAEALGGWEE